MTPERTPLAGTRNLRVQFQTGKHEPPLVAVNDVSLDIYPGEVLGLVGESGSGKSTYGRALLRLVDAHSGTVHFKGRDVTEESRRNMRPMRRQMQMVFQDPNSSLNPRMRIGAIVAEPLRIHEIGPRSERLGMVEEMLGHVQLPLDYLDRYPHQLSGGQRQRVAIARALITQPDFLVADEAVSALDVSVQAQIVNLLADLRREFGLTILMISHDLSVVQYLADRVAVMYLGRVMETGSVRQVFAEPAHPYTQALLDAVPEPDPEKVKDARPISGDIPSPAEPPSGCVFRTRCPHATDECAVEIPGFAEVGNGHDAACILLQPATPSAEANRSTTP